MNRILIAIATTFILSANCSAGSLCSPKDNNARILTAPKPNAIDPQWTGDSYIGTGWSFYVNESISSQTGLFAKGNLHGSRGGIAQRDVYILLSEWNCAETGEENVEGLERVDENANGSTGDPSASSPPETSLPQTFSVVTEKGRRVWLRVTNFGRIVMTSQEFRSFHGRDSENERMKDYRMTYRFEPLGGRVPKQDGMVVGFEFQLPQIHRGDRLIVTYRSSRPREVAEGGVGWQDIDDPWVFDSSYSGSVRTVFTGFHSAKNAEMPGEWEVSLMANGKSLVERKFELVDPTGSTAAPGIVDVPVSLAPLADLTGIWAHSSEDCKLANSGALARMTRFDSKQYQVVGFCGARFEYLHEAFSCQGTDVKKSGNDLDVETSCSLKDYDPQKKLIHIRVRNPDSLRFLDSEFEINGDYVRCSTTYLCNQN
jgi:hypothetical protein